MILHQPSPVTLNAVVLTFQSVAFVTTAYRLLFRYWTNRIWWDDFWAFVGLLFDMMVMVGFLIFSRPSESHKTYVISFWLMTLGLTVQVWAARISLAVANVRINAHPSPLRRVAVAMALLLAFFSIFLLGQKMFVCNHQSTWGHTPHRRPYCDMGLVVAIPSVSMAFVADLLLVFVPIKMFWNVKLNKNLRRLIIVLFSASILTTLASIPQAAIQIWVGGPLSSLTSEIEAAISLTVCNLLIVVTRLYHMLYDGEDIEIAYDYSRRRPLTTLDFGDTSAVCSDLTSVHFDTENSSTSTEKSVIATPESSLQSQSSGHDEEQ